jgi:hypothetical protein
MNVNVCYNIHSGLQKKALYIYIYIYIERERERERERVPKSAYRTQGYT